MSGGSKDPKLAAEPGGRRGRGGPSGSPRVVSLLPAGTDIVFALGATASLVGISHECAFPGEAPPARVTESAIDARGGNGALDPAAIDARVVARSAAGEPLFSLRAAEIAGLRPDVIVTQALCDVCAVSETDVRALAARLTPRPRVVTLRASTLDGVFADIATVADAIGRRTDGETLVAELRARMQTVHAILAASHARRPRVAVVEWTAPVYAAGHWVPEMVDRAGGADVLAVPGQHSRQVIWDAVVDAAPEVVLVAPCGYDLDQAAREAEHLVASDPWLARRAVWAVDAASLVSRPGPGLIAGIEAFAAIFNPGLFAKPADSDAIQVSG